MSLILVALTNIWVMIATFVMTFVFYQMRHIYVSSARCLRRIEALGIKVFEMPINIINHLLNVSLLQGAVPF